MSNRKRREQRSRRAGAAKQQQHRNQPPPIVAAGSVEQVKPPAETQGAAAGNQQATAHNVGESPVGTERPRVDWQLAIAITEALVSVCLLGLAVVGAWYAKGQLATMREQNAVMIEQNKIMLSQQRPWIDTDEIAFDKMKEHGLFPIRFDHKNSGQMPGTVIAEGSELHYFQPNEDRPGVGKLVTFRGSRDITFAQEHLDDLLSTGEEISPTVAVPPNGTYGFGMTGLRLLGRDVIDDIKADKIVLIALSFIVYRVPMGEKHTTWSCAFYNPASNTFTKAPRHNTMD
jgi:hypothetical protein